MTNTQVKTPSISIIAKPLTKAKVEFKMEPKLISEVKPVIVKRDILDLNKFNQRVLNTKKFISRLLKEENFEFT